MNILLINHYAGSPKHGMEYRPFHLSREWVRLGHQVTIVGASFSHLRNQQPNIVGNFTQEEIEGINYVWVKTPGYQGNNIGRVKNILSFIWQLLRFRQKLVKLSDPHIVIASSTYPLDIYPAFSIAKKSRAKLIFEVHDLWPLSPIELGGMSPLHPYIMVTQWAENFAYRVSDKVVSILPETESYMQEHGMVPSKFAYIPNGIDVVEWGNNNETLLEEHKETLARIKQAGHFVIGYAGAHGLANSLGTLIEASAFIRNHPVSFVLVGEGPEKKSLQKKVKEYKLTNVIFLPPVKRTSIPVLLAMTDALFIGWKKKPLYRFGVSPNKLVDYMMASKPIIHAIEAGNDIVAESGCGISLPPESPSAVADAIIELMNMPSIEREIMGARGREYIMTNHDYRILAQRFIEVLRSLKESSN
jgi:glycosyltransferase involved in cell wall biosynthesis